ncbi:predicted protein [Lichtheimia corymbifera JMRC:FSU:9682]|uniref:Uncharacterized protein n=1 Tax=Lichtheimia corymbifera JMRC:FSU:9682 TaxID=1263082 RepID=A0A068RVQ1_9FUNG|nr:predicted protein [Lichtheimia corymbifera JMRC:FSU:9682]
MSLPDCYGRNSLKCHIMYSQKLMSAITKCALELNLIQGNRSHLPVPEKDDSIEYDHEKLSDLLKEINDEEEREIRAYDEAINGVQLDDNGHPMLCAFDISPRVDHKNGCSGCQIDNINQYIVYIRDISNDYI